MSRKRRMPGKRKSKQQKRNQARAEMAKRCQWVKKLIATKVQ